MVLEVKGLTKFHTGGLCDVLALDDVSFEVDRGEVLGIFGANGGSKTTLIKILSSLTSQYAGSILFLGKELRDKRELVFFKENRSYLPDKDFLYENLSGVDIMKLFRDFFKDFSAEKALDICHRLNVPIDLKVKQLSKGTAEKLALALVLSRNVSLYIFDEPLAGVDVISRNEIFLLIKEYCKNGATVISTHLISSAESIVDKVLFLDKKILAYGYKEVILEGFENLESCFIHYARRK